MKVRFSRGGGVDAAALSTGRLKVRFSRGGGVDAAALSTGRLEVRFLAQRSRRRRGKCLKSATSRIAHEKLSRRVGRVGQKMHVVAVTIRVVAAAATRLISNAARPLASTARDRIRASSSVGARLRNAARQSPRAEMMAKPLARSACCIAPSALRRTRASPPSLLVPAGSMNRAAQAGAPIAARPRARPAIGGTRCEKFAATNDGGALLGLLVSHGPISWTKD